LPFLNGSDAAPARSHDAADCKHFGRRILMALTLYFHPLSSFCQKALIALYENDTAFKKWT
jgi:hypothetical protein